RREGEEGRGGRLGRHGWPDLAALPAGRTLSVKLNLSITWRATGTPPGVSGVWLEQVIERPYSREPVVGEWIQLGLEDDECDFKVEEISWHADGCHLHLGSWHQLSGPLERLRELGFKPEPATSPQP